MNSADFHIAVIRQKFPKPANGRSGRSAARHEAETKVFSKLSTRR
jgi:hypothetical protein